MGGVTLGGAGGSCHNCAIIMLGNTAGNRAGHGCVPEADGDGAVKGVAVRDAFRQFDLAHSKIGGQKREDPVSKSIRADTAGDIQHGIGQNPLGLLGGIFEVTLDIGHGQASVLPAFHGGVNGLLGDHGVLLGELSDGFGDANIGQNVTFHAPILGNNHFREGQTRDIATDVEGDVTVITLQTDLRIGFKIQVPVGVGSRIIPQKRKICGSGILDGQTHGDDGRELFSCFSPRIIQYNGYKVCHFIISTQSSIERCTARLTPVHIEIHLGIRRIFRDMVEHIFRSGFQRIELRIGLLGIMHAFLSCRRVGLIGLQRDHVPIGPIKSFRRSDRSVGFPSLGIRGYHLEAIASIPLLGLGGVPIDPLTAADDRAKGHLSILTQHRLQNVE